MLEEELLERRGVPEAEREGIHKRVRSWRLRTIAMAVGISGAVALFIGWANDSDQRDRSVKNCQLTQADRYDRIDTLLENAAASSRQADSILGNDKPLEYRPPKKGAIVGKLVVGKPVPAADFDKPPYNKFKDFKALSIANAQQQRLTAARNIARAKKVRERIENCGKVFPKPNPIPFM